MGTIRVWRICRRKYKESAFSGEGPKLYGGRFNSEGLTAVYTSGSLSLSLLEMLVRTNDRSYLRHCIIFHAEIPEFLVDSPALTDLPEGWNKIPYGHTSQDFGDDWLSSNKSLALKIPSVVIPIEYNYVLNPNHPDYSNLQIKEKEQAGIDERLFI
ncbi:MAG: RES domain-containing protein [Bacteroidetes bacterium]|jgi:RES domain-containing protein|nr:RES domain-containing protein [Bacteroidota bacterium]